MTSQKHAPAHTNHHFALTFNSDTTSVLGACCTLVKLICGICMIEHEPGNVVTMLDERCEKCIDKVVVCPHIWCTLSHWLHPSPFGRSLCMPHIRPFSLSSLAFIHAAHTSLGLLIYPLKHTSEQLPNVVSHGWLTHKDANSPCRLLLWPPNRMQTDPDEIEINIDKIDALTFQAVDDFVKEHLSKQKKPTSSKSRKKRKRP